MTHLPPLSLYIHTPWCEKKCPYCDFNSYAEKQALPEFQYVQALIADLNCDLPYVGSREVMSVFVGGGTPSLLSAEAIASVLEKLRACVPLSVDAEITLEANPGSADAEKFVAFREAGVNRLSLGVQSLNNDMLHRLGRVHDAQQARAAFVVARRAGFDNINIDLMFALPQQSFEQGVADIEQVLALEPEHISYYQLTIEPNTLFYARPPELPDDELAWRLETHAQELLCNAGYTRYEVSSYARAGYRCKHNLNYWCFGDYLGVGCGAHAKLTVAGGGILRLEKHRHPNFYLNAYDTLAFCARRRHVTTDEVVFEFMLNALRLIDGFDKSVFKTRTGVDLQSVELRFVELEERGMIERDRDRVRTTALGMRFLNEVQSAFLQPQAKKSETLIWASA